MEFCEYLIEKHKKLVFRITENNKKRKDRNIGAQSQNADPQNVYKKE